MISDRQHRFDTDYAFNGIPIHAARGVHETVLSEISSADNGYTWLEFGGGQGAFAARAFEQKISLKSYDLDPSEWRGPGRAEKLDLNNLPLIFESASIEAIVSIEVIEHLAAPTVFLKEIFRVLKPGGYFIFTTPNINSPVSLLLHALRGEFFTFSKAMYFESGHISVLPDFVLDSALAEAGLLVRRKLAAGEVRTHSRMRTLIISAISKLLWAALPAFKKRFDRIIGDGLCAVFVVQKPNREGVP